MMFYQTFEGEFVLTGVVLVCSLLEGSARPLRSTFHASIRIYSVGGGEFVGGREMVYYTIIIIVLLGNSTCSRQLNMLNNYGVHCTYCL